MTTREKVCAAIEAYVDARVKSGWASLRHRPMRVDVNPARIALIVALDEHEAFVADRAAKHVREIIEPVERELRAHLECLCAAIETHPNADTNSYIENERKRARAHLETTQHTRKA